MKTNEDDEFKDAPYRCKICNQKTFQYDEICSHTCEKNILKRCKE